MNVALDRVQFGGAPELATQLQLTDTLFASPELPTDQKNKGVDPLAFITEQAALPPDNRNTSIGTTILEGFEQIISASSGLQTLWNIPKPLLERLF